MSGVSIPPLQTSPVVALPVAPRVVEYAPAVVEVTPIIEAASFAEPPSVIQLAVEAASFVEDDASPLAEELNVNVTAEYAPHHSFNLIRHSYHFSFAERLQNPFLRRKGK